MQYGFSSVDDPERERLESMPSNKLPEVRRVLYAEVDSKVCDALLSHTANSREDIIELLELDGFEVRPHKKDLGIRPLGSTDKFLRLKGRKYQPGFNYNDFVAGFEDRKNEFLGIKERQMELINKLTKNLFYRKIQNTKKYNVGLTKYENTARNTEPLRRSAEGLDRATEEGYRPIEIEKTRRRAGCETNQSGVDCREHERPEDRIGLDYFNLIRIRLALIKKRLRSHRRFQNKKALAHPMRILRLQRIRLRKMLTRIYHRIGPDRSETHLRKPEL